MAATPVRLARRSAALMAALPLLLVADAAEAQDAVSRAVVQPLPPPAAGELGEALRRLAGNPLDFSALVDAGTASLELGDVDAAIGFFGRAQELRGGDPRVAAGLAAAYLRSDRALEAVQLFAEAERSGGVPPRFAGDRGLAYDLVGDNAAAQAQYRAALARGNDAEIVRRLALSQAIAGDKKGFEATLLPQLQARDFAAYRARAFGLAILGEEEEAVEIAQAVMPRDLSNRVEPYLRYMPRLTRAQQAAAANLGDFPRAAQIGRDDPRLAQYSNSAAVRAVDSRLAPAGEPLGPRAEDTRSQRRRPGRESSTTERVRSSASTRLAQVARDGRPREVRVAAPAQAAPPPPPPPPPTPPPEPRPATLIGGRPAVAAPGFDLARAGSSPAPAIELPPANPTPPPPSPPPPSASPPAEDPPSVADAFADFRLTPAQTEAAAAAGAVDITAIEVRREIEKPPPPPPPPPPKHPSREWVQVATGKDLNALAFDWRRFGRTAPRLLAKRNAFTTPWGVSRRLLTGPFESEKAAQEFVNELKSAGLDAFTFTSDEGQEIAPLK